MPFMRAPNCATGPHWETGRLTDLLFYPRTSVLEKHPLDLSGILRLAERQHQQHPRFDGRQILAGDPALKLLGRRTSRAATASTAATRRNSPAPRARRRDDEHAFLERVLNAFLLRAARRTSAGARNDDPLRSRIPRRFDQVAVRALIHHDHVDARQLRDRADVELALRRVPLHYV